MIRKRPRVPDLTVLLGICGPSHPITIDPNRIAIAATVCQDMFDEILSIETMIDPEDEDETPFTVFTVRGRGPNHALMEQRLEWHERIKSVNEDLSFRLSIVPIECPYP